MDGIGKVREMGELWGSGLDDRDQEGFGEKFFVVRRISVMSARPFFEIS